MFDIGFSELMVIAVVALIVIGPERLPKVARTVGHLFGRMQRYVNDVKSDISREMALDDLRKLQASMQDTARSIEESVNQEVRSAEDEMNRISADTQAAVPEVAHADTPAAPTEAAPAAAPDAGSSDPARPATPS